MLQPILKINLTTGDFFNYSPPEKWLHLYLGGASLAARILYDDLEINLDPLSEDAPLLFLNGPLSGTAGPAVGRFIVAGKSPATKLWAESNCGGFWGPELRKAGFDGIWITGRARTPVYLWINDGEIEIRSAKHLWGCDTYQTQEDIRKELGSNQIRVAGIGIGGENKLPFALIQCDHGRVAGRTGLGAVMGSKNLKAIAVKGTGTIPLANIEKYLPQRSEINRQLRVDNQSLVMRELGTAAAADYFDYLGSMPKKYFSKGMLEDAYQVSGTSVQEKILTGISACHACVIACGRIVKLDDGIPRKGPEYETLVGFGPNLLISDIKAITRMGELCDRYGIDSISMSNTIGLAFKLFEDGIITEKDTSGLQLNWGNIDSVESCIHLTAKQKGFGVLLSKGAFEFGNHFGKAEEAVQSNGLEIAYHDPRGVSGMALVYATSPRGGCHNQSDYFIAEIGQVEESLGLSFFDRHAGAEKAANVARHQDWRTVNNSLVLCIFANVPPTKVAELTSAACGLDIDIKELLKIGERSWNLKRLINHRLGLTRLNDKLPKALLTPYDDGGAEGFVPDFENMLMEYYKVRSWDPSSGYPLPEKLSALDLEWAIGDLWRSR